MKNEKYLLFSNIIAALLLTIGDIFYIIYPNLNVVKFVTSAIFVILGLSNLVYLIKFKGFVSKYNIILFIGLFFAMLGDIVLEYVFIAGAALFAIGHIFFVVAFYLYQKISIWDFVCSGVLITFAMLVIFLYPGFQFSLMMKIVVVCYAIVISIMLGKAIGNLISSKNKAFSLIVMLGALLFFVSDMMLLFGVFTDLNDVLFHALCIGTYYPAEFLLALSIAENYYLNKSQESSENQKQSA